MAVVESNRVADGAGANLTVPIGTILYHCASSAPSGFLKANGAAISRTTYANLFAVVGTTYGSGNGSSTFNVPDLRGEFIRSWDDGRGIDSGRSFASSQTDAFQGHRHSINGRAGSVPGPCGQCVPFYTTGGASIGDPTSDGTNGTPRTASETRPRNLALLACIKY